MALESQIWLFTLDIIKLLCMQNFVSFGECSGGQMKVNVQIVIINNIDPHNNHTKPKRVIRPCDRPALFQYWSY